MVDPSKVVAGMNIEMKEFKPALQELIEITPLLVLRASSLYDTTAYSSTTMDDVRNREAFWSATQQLYHQRREWDIYDKDGFNISLKWKSMSNKPATSPLAFVDAVKKFAESLQAYEIARNYLKTIKKPEDLLTLAERAKERLQRAGARRSRRNRRKGRKTRRS